MEKQYDYIKMWEKAGNDSEKRMDVLKKFKDEMVAFHERDPEGYKKFMES